MVKYIRQVLGGTDREDLEITDIPADGDSDEMAAHGPDGDGSIPTEGADAQDLHLPKSDLDEDDFTL